MSVHRFATLAGAGLVGAAIALGAALWAPGNAPAQALQGQPGTERVVVIGQRIGNLKTLLIGNTLVGTEGFADGSAPEDDDRRQDYPWRVYYMPDGTLEAHFRRFAAALPHGPIEDRNFQERGTWAIRDGELCQSIPRVGFGAEVCFELRREGNQIYLYYTQCGAQTRCYPGRMGPQGIVVPGRQLN